VCRQEDAQEQAGRNKNLKTYRKKKLEKKSIKSRSRGYGEGRNIKTSLKLGSYHYGPGERTKLHNVL